MTSRVDDVADLVGRAICSGEFEPGHRLTAEGLQERTGISRTAVREALGLLTSYRLIRPRRRIGYEVCEREAWQVLAPAVMRWRLAGPSSEAVTAELGALRALVEPAAAAGAAVTATEQERAAIAASAGTLWSAAVSGDHDGFVTADVALHREILAASGNALYRALGDLLTESLPSRAPDADSIELADARAHLDLADAVVRGDEAAAARVAAEIIAG